MTEDDQQHRTVATTVSSRACVTEDAKCNGIWHCNGCREGSQNSKGRMRETQREIPGDEEGCAQAPKHGIDGGCSSYINENDS